MDETDRNSVGAGAYRRKGEIVCLYRGNIQNPKYVRIRMINGTEVNRRYDEGTDKNNILPVSRRLHERYPRWSVLVVTLVAVCFRWRGGCVRMVAKRSNIADGFFFLILPIV